jgi:serine/threonine protein phosphatase PrpC
MRAIPDNAQDMGARTEQQDAFGFSHLGQSSRIEHGGQLAVVADGMGGLAEGRAISQLACRVMIDTYATKGPTESIPDALRRAADAAQAAVMERARQLNVDGQAGTTVAAAAVHDGSLYWISVGDTRVYLCRDGELTQLTVDHAYVRQLEQKVLAGELSEAAADAHPERRALTSFLGVEKLTDVDRNVRPFPLRAGDRVLICTDGLHGTLSEREMADILDQEGTGVAQTLVDAAIAKQRPAQDNATAALLDCPPLRATSRSAPEHALRARLRGPALRPLLRPSRLLRLGIVLALVCAVTAAGIAAVLHSGAAGPLGNRLVEQIRQVSDRVTARFARPTARPPRPPAADSARSRAPVVRTDSALSRDSAARDSAARDSAPHDSAPRGEGRPAAKDSGAHSPAPPTRPSGSR